MEVTEKIAKDTIIETDIIDLSSEGKGVAKYNDFVIFVDKGVVGDKLISRIKRVKKKYAEAVIETILSPSSFRTNPECKHFGTCNGCKMQHINYGHQLKIKRKNVRDAFERIGGFTGIEVPEVIGSGKIYHYRNKTEFSFSNDRWLTKEDMSIENIDKSFALGFHIPRFIDKVFDVEECKIQIETNDRILNFTRDFFKSHNSSVYTTRTHSGYLRYLILRNSPVTNETMVNFITSEENNTLIKEYGDELKSKFPFITTLVNSISAGKAQVAQFEYFNTIFGDGFISEKLGKYNFKITPGTFFQTNTFQAKKLFDVLLDFAEFNKSDNVLDLYCGCGAISIYISDYVSSVHGVELSVESIEGAKENAMNNNVTNCTFETKDVKDYLHNLLQTQQSQYSTIILDPPRSGIHPKAAEYLLQYEVPTIIYVSCNPATQARDIALLKEKYHIARIQPVDMFPHTHHIENAVRLELIK